ncbi:hypothetical protein MAAFP003_3581, partial [Mycobacterium ahvazicum]
VAPAADAVVALVVAAVAVPAADAVVVPVVAAAAVPAAAAKSHTFSSAPLQLSRSISGA